MENNLSICYSLNDADFIFNEFQEVIDELESEGELEVGRVYYEADCRKIKASDIVNVDRLCEEIDEQMYDLVGEFAIDAFRYNGEAEELQKMIEEWIDNNTNVSEFFRIVGKTREKKITQEDIEDSL